MEDPNSDDIIHDSTTLLPNELLSKEDKQRIHEKFNSEDKKICCYRILCSIVLVQCLAETGLIIFDFIQYFSYKSPESNPLFTTSFILTLVNPFIMCTIAQLVGILNKNLFQKPYSLEERRILLNKIEEGQPQSKAPRTVSSLAQLAHKVAVHHSHGKTLHIPLILKEPLLNDRTQREKILQILDQ